jgi:hypothetical protein
MSITSLVDSVQLDSDLTSIANTIRDKRDLPSSTKLTFPTDFITEIDLINPYILGSKTITANGTYNPLDDNLDGYSSLLMAVHPGLIAPMDFDNSLGYVQNGKWTRGGTTVSYSDIYEVEANKNYFLSLGGTVGTRFRAIFTTTNINETELARVSGTAIIYTNDPPSYSSKAFSTIEDGYVIIQKDNQGTAGLKSYLYDLVLLPDE